MAREDTWMHPWFMRFCGPPSYGAWGRAFKLGQYFLPGSDVCGRQLCPDKDAAYELRHSLWLLVVKVRGKQTQSVTCNAVSVIHSSRFFPCTALFVTHSCLFLQLNSRSSVCAKTLIHRWEYILQHLFWCNHCKIVNVTCFWYATCRISCFLIFNNLRCVTAVLYVS